MTDIRTRIERAVEAMAGQPSVSLGAPATNSMLDRAEERLGQALPADLRELLSIANGVSVKDGLRRILGVERSDAPDLVEFNRYDTWKYAWPTINLEDKLIWGITYDHHFSAYLPDLVTQVSGMLVLPDSIQPNDMDLVTRLERGWVGMATRPMHPDDAAIRNAVGPVAPDQGVHLGTRFFLKADPDPAEARLFPLEQVLRMAGGLDHDSGQLPPGSVVAAPFCEHDESGRERWRWITDQDLPGLASRADGTFVSHHRGRRDPRSPVTDVRARIERALEAMAEQPSVSFRRSGDPSPA